jgi:DNA-binding response OmpR family regulator/anti-sigma regulatory factor (Ser/Thr protein kinase)
VSKQINFEFSFDKEKVRKIVMNLLSNAFKFSPEQSTIIFEVEINEANISTSIKDNGIGIPDKDKKKVFDRFYQIDHSHLNYGNGIGLHIVSEYVSLLKGTISLHDNQPQGCIFTFTLPKNTEDTPLNRQELDSDQDIAKSDVNVEGKRPAILIVEDNNDFRIFIEECLNQEYKTYQAANGKDALDILEAEQIDVVISDIMMPVMDGLELCNKIKNNINLSHIPVILLTARTADEHKLEGLREGADEYITKPFNLKILKLRIEKVLQWKLTRHEKFRKKIEIKASEITISSLDELFVEKAIKIVEENMSNSNFSVEDLSSAMGLSRGHLYNKLMNITGKAPLDFIRLLQLKRSKQYIAKSQMNISEIAYAVGFNTPKVFSTYFKLEFGMSPREYKNSSDNIKSMENIENEENI